MKYLDLILDYLNGNLNSEDSAQFERDLLIYNDLLAEFEGVLNLLDVIREEMEVMKEISPQNDYDEDTMGVLDAVFGIDSTTGEILPDEFDLISDIPKIAGRYTVIKKKCPFGKRFMAAAAIMLLIITTAVLPDLVRSKCSNDRLFERFHEGYYISVQRSIQRNSNDNLDRSQIILWFNSGNYSAVVAYVQSLDDIRVYDTEIVFSFGVSFLLTDNYSAAIECFDLIDNNTLYYTPAMWEIALTYLKAGQSEKAIEIMNRLRKIDSVYEKDIRKIIRCIRVGNIASLFTIKRKYIS